LHSDTDISDTNQVACEQGHINWDLSTAHLSDFRVGVSDPYVIFILLKERGNTMSNLIGYAMLVVLGALAIYELVMLWYER
jgi:hypothetical protein